MSMVGKLQSKMFAIAAIAMRMRGILRGCIEKLMVEDFRRNTHFGIGRFGCF